MSVYVDDMQAGFGHMVMCHMIADSTEELVAMAVAIGVKTKWIKKSGTYAEHLDICKTKRAQAIKRGAILITQRELGRRLVKRRRNKTALQLVVEDAT